MRLFNRKGNKPKPYQNLNAESFAEGIQKDGKQAVILDVRTPGECAAGMIPGAIQINFLSPGFGSKVAGLDKEKTYYVYCRSGHRSSNACGAMAKRGFEHLYNLSGGFSRWDGEVVAPRR